MNKSEIIFLIKRNQHKRKDAITLISDFLAISRKEAEKIYQEEIENV